MRIRNGVLLMVEVTMLLAGCATDRVIFVTKTSIGIDADTTPPTVSIAYDRTDGYFGPRYDSGAVPPVVSSIKTDLAIFAPKIRQVYATGNAAMLVLTDPPPQEVEKLELTGKKKTMFFGTSTTVGLKLGFDASGVPESILLGYKRKEISVIPLGTKTKKNGNGEDVEIDTYPSVIASIDMRVRSASLDDTSLALSQFFATGNAADELARGNEEIRSSFKTIAEKATDSRTAYIVPVDVQTRKVLINRYVRGLVDAGDKTTLDAIATKLGVPVDPNIIVERRKVLSEMDERVINKDSMDQLSTLLHPITQKDF
jgi:hypothetical protein